MKERNLVFILASSTILAMAWIGFAIYHTSVTSTIDQELSIQIQPIAPVFNQAAIKNILNRNDTEPTFEIKGLNKRPTPTTEPADDTSTTSQNASRSADTGPGTDASLTTDEEVPLEAEQ